MMIREIHIVREIYRAIRHLIQPGKEIVMNVGDHAVTFKGTHIEIIIELAPVFNKQFLKVDDRLAEPICSFSKSEYSSDVFSDQYIDKSVTLYYKECKVEEVTKLASVSRAIRTLIQEMKNEKIGF
jgi:hypothetical protein